MNKKSLVILLFILLMLTVIMVILVPIFTSGTIYTSGVYSLRFVKNEGGFTVKLYGVEDAGFSVKNIGNVMPSLGDVVIDPNELLKPNRIQIEISDCKVSKKLIEKYSAWEVYELVFGESIVQFMWCYNNVHGITVFLASDDILCVNEQPYTKLEDASGTLSIEVSLNSKK